MEQNFFNLDDLEGLLSEFNDSVKDESAEDSELEASQKRYNNYIKKHKEENHDD